MSIKYGKYKSLKRLKDALISNAFLNQVDAFKTNYAMLSVTDPLVKDKFKNNLIDHAIKNASLDVAEILIKDGAMCNYNSCIYECNWNKLDKVYTLINDLHTKYGSFTMNTVHMHKGMIINRLLDPEKAHTNRERLSYVIELLRDGFLDADEIKAAADKLYNDHKYQGEFKQFTRELILNELGI